MINEAWLKKCVNDHDINEYMVIRSDKQADIKRLSVRKGTEILAIEVSIDNKKFFFLVYGVDNLDDPNHANILISIKLFTNSDAL